MWPLDLFRLHFILFKTGSRVTKLRQLGRVTRETKALNIAVKADSAATSTVLGWCKDKQSNVRTVFDFGMTKVDNYSFMPPFPACGTI